MSEPSRVIRGTVRAAVGLVVVAVAATALLLLESFAIPNVERTPPAISVDTMQDSTQTLVCAGAFSVLGADPNRPEAAIPTGAPATVVSGAVESAEPLARTEGGEAPPVLLTAPAGDLLGAAQVQAVSTETAAGAVASACTAPKNEQWLLGGDTGEGMTATLSVSNANDVPATVQIAVYDETGLVSDARTSAVLVPPRSEQIVSLNGYAPDRASIAVHVVSTGAPVAATLGLTQIIGIDPYGVSTITAQTEATEQLVVPGVTYLDMASNRGPSDVGEDDAFGVRVRVMSPGGEGGMAAVSALTEDGTRIELGQVPLVGNAIAELAVPQWPAEANAVVVDADVPVIGGVLGMINAEKTHDFAWFTPAPQLAADTEVAVPVVEGGELVIVNTGSAEAEVTWTPPEGAPRTFKVGAGSAEAVSVGATGVLSSTAPVHAGVRYSDGGSIDAYPIQAAPAREGELTVYLR